MGFIPMPRTLACCLVSAALILAAVTSGGHAEAKPAKVGDSTAHELAAQSRPTAKLSPAAHPWSKGHKAKAAPHPKVATPVTPAKPHATPAPAPTAKAKPKPDQKIKAVEPKAKPKAKPAPVRPGSAPTTPTPTPLARA
jgi:hypothetical protein